MLLLGHWVIVLLLVRVHFTQPHYLISGVLLLYRLDLSLVHVVVYQHSLFDEIDSYFGNLLFYRLLQVFLELPGHPLYAYLPHMVVIVVWVLSWVYLVLVSFYEWHALRSEPVVPILIELNGPFPYFLNSLHESIHIPVRVVLNYPHSAVNLN